MVHVAILKASSRSAQMKMHPSQAAQIAALKWDEALIKILSEYADYTYVFSFSLVIELLENTGINKHTIELQDDKQLPYGPIYSLGPVKLKILKTYIKTYLKTGFIQT